MKKVTRRDYDCFSWLPIERWNVDNLMGPRLNAMIFCKICDEYFPYDTKVKHIDKHIAQRKRHMTEDKKKAKAARLEAARLARQIKKEEKLAGNS